MFGVPHDKWGETPVAAVTFAADSRPDPAHVQEWVNRNVGAKFQRISDIVVLESFPTNVAGKTLKREIRERYITGQSDKF